MMPTAKLEDQLVQLAQRIFDILTDGRRSLSVIEAHQWKALALARWDMMVALQKFTEFKIALLQDVIDGGDPGRAQKASAIEQANRALQQAYDNFVHRWELLSPLSIDLAYRTEAGGANPNWLRRTGAVASIFVGAVAGAALLLAWGVAAPLAVAGALVLFGTLACTLHPAGAAKIGS